MLLYHQAQSLYQLTQEPGKLNKLLDTYSLQKTHTDIHSFHISHTMEQSSRILHTSSNSWHVQRTARTCCSLHTHLKTHTENEIRSWRIISSCYSSGTRHVTLVTNWWKVLNEKRTRLWLRPPKNISGHLWHRYSVTVNQVMVATVKLSSNDFNLTTRNPWFSSFLVSSNPLWRKR